jgi:uncharacterized protein (AIM24 family)
VIDPRSAETTAGIFADEEADVSQSHEFDHALEQGTEALQRGDAALARNSLEKALRHKPRNQRARNLLGLSLFKLGELPRAEAIYRGLIEDHPADPTLRVNLGLVFLKSMASADAVRCFETALDLSPDHQKAQNYLGLALAQKGDLGRAREWFRKSGNTAMADRMSQALADSPVREVANEAERTLSEEKPFRSALEKEPGTVPTAPSGAPAHHQTDKIPAMAAALATGTLPAAEPATVVDLPAAAGPPEAAAPRTMPAFGTRWVATDPATPAAPPVAPREHATPLGRIAAHGPSPEAPLASTPGADLSDATALASYTSSTMLTMPASDGGFGIGPTEVLIQLKGEMLTRLDGLVASWGSVVMKPELKRFRGKATDKPFGEGARRMLRGSGEGRFIISREGRHFTALELGDEPAYFREEILFAFQESIVFENGRVPSRTGSDLHLVHLRGRGKLLLVTAGTPKAVEIIKGEPMRIPMDQLVGWHGPLIQPRLVPIVEEAPELGVALELAGEGRALLDAPDGR